MRKIDLLFVLHVFIHSFGAKVVWLQFFLQFEPICTPIWVLSYSVHQRYVSNQDTEVSFLQIAARNTCLGTSKFIA